MDSQRSHLYTSYIRRQLRKVACWSVTKISFTAPELARLRRILLHRSEAIFVDCRPNSKRPGANRDISYEVRLPDNAQPSLSKETLASIQVLSPLQPFLVKSQSMGMLPVFLNFPQSILKSGKADLALEIVGDSGFAETRRITLFGPEQ